jgi:glycerol kinase
MSPSAAAGSTILAIDQGTTGTKALLLDRELRILAEATREFPQHFPAPGQVEHELEEVFASVRGAVGAAIASAGVAPKSIAAIGVTNQRETTAIWERGSGRPIHRAIVWQDRRTTEHCQELKRQGLEAKFREVTGLLLDPYFSGTKIAWLLDHVRGARARSEAGELCFGTIDTYLTWRLTAGRAHVTDVSNASRTLLMDLGTCAWSDELLEILRVPRAVLPEIRSSDAVLGETRGLDFLPDGIPIAGLLGDQQSALFGQVCFERGEAKCTYGTGAFLMLNTGERIVRSKRGLLSTCAWRLGGKTVYALEGSAFIAGAIVQWLRDGLRIIHSSDEVEELARSVESSDGVIFVPALTGLGAPHWDPTARGLIAGITRGTTAAHIARAALDGVAFQIHDILSAMQQDLAEAGDGAKAAIRDLKVDGGAARNHLLMQFQADILGCEVVRPQITSTTALGAALLAGLAVGVFPSTASICKIWKEDCRFKPKLKRKEVTELLKRWERAVRQARL